MAETLLASTTANVKLAGLGARDTLRLEAGMPLYGHELGEDITPYEAGLGFAVHLKDRDFPGAKALATASSETVAQKRIRVGLTLAGKRVPREHYQILQHEQVVGEVTSGTFSPTLDHPIAMGFVAPELAEVGTELQIDIRGKHVTAKVAELPFYKRT